MGSIAAQGKSMERRGRQRWSGGQAHKSTGETPDLCPVRAVERAVLDGFAQVAGFDVRGGIQIGNRPRYFQDAVVGASRKPQPGDAVSSSFSPSAEIAQYLRMSLGGIWALA